MSGGGLYNRVSPIPDTFRPLPSYATKILDGKEQLMKYLTGFLRAGGGWSISSVAAGSMQRKVLKETKFDSKAAAQTVYVRECLTHKNSPFIRINLFTLIANEKGQRQWEKIAEGMACPLCWKIMKVYEEEEDWKLPKILVDEHQLKTRDLRYKKRA